VRDAPRQLSTAGFVRQGEKAIPTVEDMQTLEPRHDEREKVQSWRLHVLIEAGFPFELAERLADSDVDLHGAVGLIENGCAPEIAVRILL
jgi:hypothetical protein